MRTRLNIYEPGRLSTLDQVWERATAVVDADVLRATPYDSSNGVDSLGRQRPPSVSTSYAARVRVVFKAGPGSQVQPNTTIHIVRVGGMRDRGEYIEEVVDENFPQFEVGQRYVLFLTGNQPAYSYFGVASADGVFKIQNDRLTSIGKGRSSLSLAGRPLAVLLEELKRLSAGGREER